MSFSAASLYRDSFNFFRNRFTTFLVLALMVTLIKSALSFILPVDFKAIDETYKINLSVPYQKGIADSSDNQSSSSVEEERFNPALIQSIVNQYESLSAPQQQQLLIDLAILLLKISLPSFISLSLLILWGCTIMTKFSHYEEVSFPNIIYTTLSLLPNVLIFNYFLAILIIFSGSLFIYLLPLIAINLFMAPLILVIQRKRFIPSIVASFKITFKHPIPIITAIISYYFGSFFITSLCLNLFASFIPFFLLMFISQLMSSLLLIYFMLYFYRLLIQTKMVN